jgi:hypothetical protein
MDGACRLRDLESPGAGASSPRPPERIIAKSGSGPVTPRTLAAAAAVTSQQTGGHARRLPALCAQLTQELLSPGMLCAW